MSLFQCEKCGVCENTALSNAGHHELLYLFRDELEALASYRVVLGLPENTPLGLYCSACTPLWFTDKGELGIGPNPNPLPEAGLWHGRFPQKFYPLGTMETDHQGNLASKKRASNGR